MKKLTIGVLCAGALAVAAALTTSYYTGIKIQEAFEQNAEAWSSEDGFSVQILEYDRGLLSSQAQTLWSFAGEEEANEITVTHDILHGPWPMGHAAKVVSRFLLPDNSEPQLKEALQQQAPLEWTTIANWSGDTNHTLFSPKFSTTFADGSTLSWGGLQAEWFLSALRDHTQGFIRIPALQVQVEDGSNIKTEDAALTFDTRIPSGHAFWIGPTSLTLGLLSAQDTENQTHLNLQKLELHASNTLEGSLIQSNLDGQLAHIETQAYSADNVALQMAFKNLDAAVLDQLMLWTQSGAEESNIDWLRSLPQFLAGKPEVAITRLSMNSPDGPIHLSARLAYVGTQPEALNPATDFEGQMQTSLPLPILVQLLETKVRNDYLDLLEQMNHELDEEALQTAVDDGVNKRLKALLEHGALKQQGDIVEMDLNFSNGEFKLNNQPQTLQQLLSLGSGL